MEDVFSGPEAMNTAHTLLHEFRGLSDSLPIPERRKAEIALLGKLIDLRANYISQAASHDGPFEPVAAPVTAHRNRRSDIKPTRLNVTLVAPAVLAMLMVLAGCGSDRHDYDRDRDRPPDRERRDSDRQDQHRDSDRHDEGRGSR